MRHEVDGWNDLGVDDAAAAAALNRARFPRASAYDPTWLLDRVMGPHPLWLLEDLLEVTVLEPGMRVLDLGAGYGVTSAFLARECGVEVLAVDPMIPPSTITATAAAQGVADRVVALTVEVAEHVADGAALWLDWNEITLAHRDLAGSRRVAESETAMLRADAGRTFGFVRLLACRPTDPAHGDHP